MRNWFNRVQREFAPVFQPFDGKPFCYVEIGVWTGDSAEWVLQNHPRAFGCGIDSYLPDRRRRQGEIDQIEAGTRERLKPYRDRWTLVKGKSQNVLRAWGDAYQWIEGLLSVAESPFIDVLYIDGSHCAHDVLMDYCFAWPHLRAGSRVIFDDYGIGTRWERKSGLPNVPTAAEAIVACFGPTVQVLSRGRQLALEVLDHRVGILPPTERRAEQERLAALAGGTFGG